MEQEGGKTPIIVKVQLKFPHSFISLPTEQETDLFTLEKEVREGTTIGDLLANLASIYTDFGKVIFNSDTGEVSDRIMVILNRKLLQGPDVEGVKLNNGDAVFLIPTYSGG